MPGIKFENSLVVESSPYEGGYVRRVEAWGSDECVIDAARMSTGRGFQSWDKDEKLLAYLWNNRHTSPFEQCGLIVEVQAPLFVLRQWQRHRTQSYSEFSGRYAVMEDCYYLPEMDRVCFQSKVNGQGSEGQVPPELAKEFIDRLHDDQMQIESTYSWAIKNGISRELARLNCPLSRYSRMRASANLLNWLRFLGLRRDHHTQEETREYACALGLILESAFPRTYRLAKEHPL